MELRGCDLRWFAMVCGDFRIVWKCVWLGETYYFGTWTRQKSDRTRIWPDPVRFKPVWSTLGWCLVCVGSVFCKKVLASLGGKHISEKQLQALSIRFCTFLLPKRPQKEHFFSLYLPFSLFWPFRSQFFRFLKPLEFCVWPMTCAFLAFGARSAKTTACLILTFL